MYNSTEQKLIVTKQNYILMIISPFLPITSYGGAFVPHWALHLPEVPTGVREHRQRGKPACVGRTATDCQLLKSLPPC